MKSTSLLPWIVFLAAAILCVLVFACSMPVQPDTSIESAQIKSSSVPDQNASSSSINSPASQSSCQSSTGIEYSSAVTDIWEREISAGEGMPVFVLRLYRDQNVNSSYFNKFSILDPEGTIVHSAEYEKDDEYIISREQFAVESIDINFDGYLDVQILHNHFPTWKKHCSYFIWKPDEASYICDPYGLSNLGNPVFDAERKLVYSEARASAGDHWSYKHQYIDGKLAAIEEVAENLVWDLYKDESAQKRIAILEPLYREDTMSFIQYRKKQLNFQTMEMPVVELKYMLYEDKTGYIAEYSPNSEIGQLLAQYETSSDFS